MKIRQVGAELFGADGGTGDGQTDMMKLIVSGFGGLGVACWPLVPKFAGSNPAEAVGFLRAKKYSARLLSEGK
jgi:hypothetical protein